LNEIKNKSKFTSATIKIFFVLQFQLKIKSSIHGGMKRKENIGLKSKKCTVLPLGSLDLTLRDEWYSSVNSVLLL